MVYILMLQQIEGRLLYPRIVGSQLRLPSFWVLAAVVCGMRLGGAGGIFVAVPLCALAYTLLREDAAARLASRGPVRQI